MILLIAAPSPARTALASFLDHERLPAKICDGIDAGMATYLKTPHFDLLLVEHRLADGSALSFMKELARRKQAVAVIVIGAPLKAEAGLLRSGALAVLGAGYSPRSAALQCLSLKIFLSRKAAVKRGLGRMPANEFDLGGAVISSTKRQLRSKRNSSLDPVRLSRLQVRLLQALRASPGKVLDYEFIFHTIWRRAYRGKNGAIREAMSALRKQFQRAGLNLDHWIATVHGEGYRYDRK